MTKKIRTILFLGLLVFFLIIAPYIIFYSYGYRLNFDPPAGGARIVKTGAFYFKVLPKSTKITVTPLDNKGNVVKDKEVVKKTDFFFGAAFIEDLLPRKYQVEITKEGYFSWKKILEINENQATEGKNIILFPQSIGDNLLTQKVEDFFPSPNERIIILKEAAEISATSSVNSSFNATSSGWYLKSFDIQSNVRSQLISSQDIAKTGQVELQELKFSPDSRWLLLKLKVKQRVKYYFVDLNQTPVKATSLDFLTEDYQNIIFYPNNSRKLIVFKNGAIFEADINQKKISPKIIDNIKSINVSDQDFYYIDNSGFLYRTDPSFSRQNKLNDTVLSLDKNSDCQINILTNWIFLQNGQKLYFLNSDSKSFEKFSEPNKGMRFSPDFKKLIYYSDHEVWVLFLESETSQPQKEKGSKVFISRFSDKIDSVYWLTSNYLVFNSGGKIKIAEIDDRDTINIIDLASFANSKIFWDQNFRKLFIQSESNFYSLKELLP